MFQSVVLGEHQVGFPEQFVLVDARKPKRIDTDKNGKLFHSDEHAVQEIFQRGKTPVEHPFF